ncbi:MAG TPA: metalloregulator ArsR/SmtB family transcription factor [Pseudomonadales bacterium]|nr:metalloregulator ArsR/SmtB family transcription factor [Pseudomonadales bacterium]
MNAETTPYLAVETLSTLCHASGESLRLQILRALSRDSFGVLELCQIFDAKQPSLSHHLKVLAKAGLVTTRREGNSIFYRRATQANHPLLINLHRALWDVVDALILPPECAARLDAVNRARAERSEQFFREYAGKFQSHQEQIASVELYTHEVLHAIDSHCQRLRTAVEIGPGEGAFLPSLAMRFKHVVALDSSSAMLALAKSAPANGALTNVEWLNGDTQTLRAAAAGVDCQVINMVLHHVSSPQQIFDDCFAVAAEGGLLIITDLCEHDQTWAQEACGDLWLGLSSDDILQWADHAGWQRRDSSYFAQRNGFTIQLHCFYKPARQLK